MSHIEHLLIYFSFQQETPPSEIIFTLWLTIYKWSEEKITY